MQLIDGFQCFVALEFFPNVWFWERETQPLGVDGGGAIEVATMRNFKYRPKAPPWLKNLDEMTLQVSWDPALISHMASNVTNPVLPGALASWIVNVHQKITIAYPDDSGHRFYGWVSSFKPASMKEKEFPLAEMKIMPSNLLGQGSSFNPPGTSFGETDITYIPSGAHALCDRPATPFSTLGNDRVGHVNIRGISPIFP